MRFALLALLLFLWAGHAAAQESLHRALAPYALFQTDITGMLDAEIADAAALDQALHRAAGHDPDQLARGWIAYGALTAAQSPAWVDGVRSRVRAAGRAAVLRQLRRDMTYAQRRPPGAAEATQLVLRALAADTARMNAMAIRFEGLGAGGDTSAWARRTPAREAALRAPGVRTLAPEVSARLRPGPLTAAPLSEAGAFGGPRFWDALGDRASPAPPPLPWRAIPQRAGLLDRMFTLGALMVIGATESEAARVGAALGDASVGQCLGMQQLQLRQCASVTNAPNEDAYCLARHGYAGPAQCLSLAAPA